MRKASDVYTAAAERIYYGMNYFSCFAVSAAEGNTYEYSNLVRRYVDLFVTGHTAGPYGYLKLGGEQEARQWRITALCLMAAIAESEGD
jgi:hypothetical protein